jgi:hypothetical protein
LTTPASGQSAISAGSALFTVTLAKGYSSASYIATCTFAGPGAGTPGVTNLYCVKAGATSYVVYNGTAFTPVLSTTYSFQFQTISAGAAT